MPLFPSRFPSFRPAVRGRSSKAACGMSQASLRAVPRSRQGRAANFLAESGRVGRNRSDIRAVHPSIPASAASAATSGLSLPEAAPYGLPAEAFSRAWTVQDIQEYLQIGRTQAYTLVKNPSFPARLRTGRSHRWNGLQVMAWFHGDGAAASDKWSPAPVLAAGTWPDSADPSQPATALTRSAGEPVESETAMASGDLDVSGESTERRPPARRRVIDPAEVLRERQSSRIQGLTAARANRTGRRSVTATHAEAS